MLSKFLSYIAFLFSYSLPLFLVVDDPGVLEQLLSCLSVLGVILHALDQEILLLIGEDLFVLYASDNFMRIKRREWGTFTLFNVKLIVSIHRKTISSEDKSENAQAPNIHRCCQSWS